MSRPLDLTFHTERRDGVESLRIQLGTCLVGRIEVDPEYATHPWGVSVYLAGARQPDRCRDMRHAQQAAAASIENWLQRAHLR
jgi:hypothetical protein